MKDNTFYISIDIEADGPIPGKYSMLSLGAVAYDSSGIEKDSFCVNIKPLEGAQQDKGTMKWWEGQPEAWKAVQIDRKDPKVAMESFASFTSRFIRPVAVCYPAGFDWTFVYWYLTYFDVPHELGFSCYDIKSMAAAALNCPFKLATKSRFPKSWHVDQEHTHIALDDAREQGQLFFKIKEYLDTNVTQNQNKV